ncbi:MAG: cytidylate kinase-like family protein [Clostridia bacterium]|nr:cytidylate kinase-like family protein [Clostridia bacterium]
MGIITISREFGSGGRELGKRLADELGYAYYDKEIVSAIAEKNNLDEHYVAYALEGGAFRNFPVHFGRTFSYSPTLMANESKLLSEQNKLIKEFAAQGNCVIVGRAADVILREHRPFNLFVYADMASKIQRCQERAQEDEHLSARQMEKKIKKIDADRKRYHGIISDIPWGDKRGYHLCVNTTDREIKTLVPIVASYIRQWFEERGE